MKSREWMLKELYQALWISADFESDLFENFPNEFNVLKWNENKVSDESLTEMYEFLNGHPVFN